MRQHHMSFANFILRFGPEEVMLDYAEDILLPAFLNDAHVRTYGDTELRFYNVKLANIGEEKNGDPIVGLCGHFVKDTVLRRQQIFRRGVGLVDDERAMESAPSSFFILILNNHRLLYFAETAAAPTLETFQATAEYFLRQEWHTYVRQRQVHENVTRRGSERLTLAQVQRRTPPPVLAVVPVAGEDAITESIRRFGIIKQIRFKLIQPNDEIDASKTVAAVEKTFRPLDPSRLEVVASGPKGLNKEEAARTITEAAEGHNTEIVVDGEDKAGLKLKVDNNEFALTVPLDKPPEADEELQKALTEKYEALVAAGKVRRLPTPAGVKNKLRRLVGRV